MKMNNPKKNYKKLARVIKAIAHPGRLQLLDILKKGDLCVCELQCLIKDNPDCIDHIHGDIGSDISTISRHLSQMRDAGIIEDRREGKKIIYHLKIPCILDFIDCILEAMKNKEAEE